MNSTELNYFGIQGLKQCTAKEKIKYRFSKLLFLNPYYSPYKAKLACERFTDELAIHFYSILIERDLKKYDSTYIAKNILSSLSYWINENGFLSITELHDIRDYCGLEPTEYLRNLCEVFPEIKFEQSEKCLRFLDYYSKYIDEKFINIVLDNYMPK